MRHFSLLSDSANAVYAKTGQKSCPYLVRTPFAAAAPQPDSTNKFGLLWVSDIILCNVPAKPGSAYTAVLGGQNHSRGVTAVVDKWVNSSLCSS